MRPCDCGREASVCLGRSDRTTQRTGQLVRGTLRKAWNLAESVMNLFPFYFSFKSQPSSLLEKPHNIILKWSPGCLALWGSSEQYVVRAWHCLCPPLGIGQGTRQHTPCPGGAPRQRHGSVERRPGHLISGLESTPLKQEKKLLEAETWWVRAGTHGKWKGVQKRAGRSRKREEQGWSRPLPRIQRPLSWESLKWMASRANGKQVFPSLLPARRCPRPFRRASSEGSGALASVFQYPPPAAPGAASHRFLGTVRTVWTPAKTGRVFWVTFFKRIYTVCLWPLQVDIMTHGTYSMLNIGAWETLSAETHRGWVVHSRRPRESLLRIA